MLCVCVCVWGGGVLIPVHCLIRLSVLVCLKTGYAFVSDILKVIRGVTTANGRGKVPILLPESQELTQLTQSLRDEPSPPPRHHSTQQEREQLRASIVAKQARKGLILDGAAQHS